MLRRLGLRLLRGVPATAQGTEPAAAASQASTLGDTAALAAEGLQAFLEQVRWAIAAHDKRSEVFGQRAAAVLGFDGVIISALIAGFALIKDEVAFAGCFLVNAVAVVALPALSAFVSLWALWPRKVTIPESKQLRDHWAAFRKSESTVRPQAQIVHDFLGGAKDPVASARDEAASRGNAYKAALLLLIGAVVALAALTGQVIAQQTCEGVTRMSESQPEPEPDNDPQPEPSRFEVETPAYEVMEKQADQSGVETRDLDQ